VLVRHAEKASDDDDPPLTDAGLARAAALEHALEDAGIGAIYVSDFTRTRQTAAPLAKRLGLEVQLYDPDRSEEEARRIVAAHPGETILVVGHKPSVPRMVNELLGPDATSPERMDRLERYDDLVILTLPDGGPATLTRLRYGQR
jgi:broad specificity phosphatase PhoE